MEMMELFRMAWLLHRSQHSRTQTAVTEKAAHFEQTIFIEATPSQESKSYWRQNLYKHNPIIQTLENYMKFLSPNYFVPFSYFDIIKNERVIFRQLPLFLCYFPPFIYTYIYYMVTKTRSRLVWRESHKWGHIFHFL